MRLDNNNQQIEQFVKNMLKRKKCNGCGGEDFKLLYFFKNFNVLKCESCGLVFRDIILTEEEGKRLYGENYFLTDKNVLTGQIKDFKNKLNELNKITSKRKLLDIGCSIGTFMEVALKDDWEVYGFDISKFAINICRSKGLTVYENFKDLPKFDVITVWNMIDHAENPQEYLQEIISHLNNNGILIISTSTTDNWLYQLAHYLYKLGIKKPVELCYPIHHSTYFSTSALSKILQKAGLDVFNCHKTQIGFFNTIFLPLIKKIDLVFDKYSLEKIFLTKLQ